MEKNEYRKRRENGERGQGPKESIKFYEKGEKIPYVNRDGEDSEYPNSSGAHLVRIPKRGLQYLNRADSRRQTKSRSHTKQNLKARKPFVNPHEYKADKDPHNKAFVSPAPEYPSKLSNHVRHRQRQLLRVEK